jgi:predicted Zn-dependent protease
MYLPMLAVLVPLVLAVEALLRRHAGAARLPVVAGTALAVVTVPFVLAARAHAALFQDQKVFWTAAYQQNEMTSGSMVSAIILGAYAQIVHDEGKLQEALALLERAMRCEAKMERIPLTYGEFLREAGRLDESEAVLRELLRTRPDVGPAHGVLAFILVTRHEAALVQGLAGPSDPRLVEAVQLAKRAYELDAQPAFLNTLGMALTRQGNMVDAERVLRDVLREEPDFLDAKKSLAALLCFTDRMSEGIKLLREVAAGKPKDTTLRLSIVQAYLQVGDTASAILMLREVLSIEPGRQDAQQLLQQLESAPR